MPQCVCVCVCVCLCVCVCVCVCVCAFLSSQSLFITPEQRDVTQIIKLLSKSTKKEQASLTRVPEYTVFGGSLYSYPVG